MMNDWVVPESDLYVILFAIIASLLIFTYLLRNKIDSLERKLKEKEYECKQLSDELKFISVRYR